MGRFSAQVDKSPLRAPKGAVTIRQNDSEKPNIRARSSWSSRSICRLENKGMVILSANASATTPGNTAQLAEGGSRRSLQ